MKYQENISDVAEQSPDYLGFIFYEKSPRNFDGVIPELPKHIKKVGVFVNATVDFINTKIEKYGFSAIQLHGNETPEFCKTLRALHNEIEIFKVFSIKDAFDFSVLSAYEDHVDYFLFDTKGKEKGGNGYKFDWSVLEDYSSTTPFILSGGIGLHELSSVQSFLKQTVAKYLYALDVNSKFEIKPGLKNIDNLKEFKQVLKTYIE